MLLLLAWLLRTSGPPLNMCPLQLLVLLLLEMISFIYYTCRMGMRYSIMLLWTVSYSQSNQTVVTVRNAGAGDYVVHVFTHICTYFAHISRWSLRLKSKRKDGYHCACEQCCGTYCLLLCTCCVTCSMSRVTVVVHLFAFSICSTWNPQSPRLMMTICRSQAMRPKSRGVGNLGKVKARYSTRITPQQRAEQFLEEPFTVKMTDAGEKPWCLCCGKPVGHEMRSLVKQHISGTRRLGPNES